MFSLVVSTAPSVSEYGWFYCPSAMFEPADMITKSPNQAMER